MSAPNRFINWLNGKFTATSGPASGTVFPIVGVVSCSVSRGGQIWKESGDNDRYSSDMEMIFEDPQATVTSNKPDCLDLIPNGTKGTFEIDRLNASNGAAVGGGGYHVTLLHAMIDKGAQSGSHKQSGSGQATFHGYAPDGTTNPLTVVAL